MRTAKIGKRVTAGTIVCAENHAGIEKARARGVNPNSLANLKPFLPGNLANPGGRPVKSRNRLQGDFVRRLAEDFERFGIYAIARARHMDPLGYLRVVASLIPKEMEISTPMDGITDEQLDAAIATVRAILAAQGGGATDGGTAASGMVRP